MFDSIIIYIIFILLIIISIILGLAYSVYYFYFRKTQTKSLEDAKLQRLNIVRQLFFAFSCLFLFIFLYSLRHTAPDILTFKNLALAVSIVSLATAYTYKSSLNIILSLLGFFIWTGSITTDLFSSTSHVYYPFSSTLMFLCLGVIYVLVGIYHNKLIRFISFTNVYKYTGYILLSLVLSSMTNKSLYAGFNRVLKSPMGTETEQILVQLFFYTALFFLSACFLFFIVSVSRLLTNYEMLLYGGLLFLFLIQSFFTGQEFFIATTDTMGFDFQSYELSGFGLSWILLMHVVTIAFFIHLIILGGNKKNNVMINFGVGLTFLFIIYKYFDWFSDFLDKSLFFVVSGILLLGLGWFMEKTRKKLLIKSKTDIKIQTAH